MTFVVWCSGSCLNVYYVEFNHLNSLFLLLPSQKCIRADKCRYFQVLTFILPCFLCAKYWVQSLMFQNLGSQTCYTALTLLDWWDADVPEPTSACGTFWISSLVMLHTIHNVHHLKPWCSRTSNYMCCPAALLRGLGAFFPHIDTFGLFIRYLNIQPDTMTGYYCYNVL